MASSLGFQLARRVGSRLCEAVTIGALCRVEVPSANESSFIFRIKELVPYVDCEHGVFPSVTCVA